MSATAPGPTTGDSNAGKRVGGYEIVRKVGQGGMGAVFLARQLSMDRLVALKILPPDLARNEAYVQRFQREARAAGALNHPNLINVYDCGQAGAYHFIAMEFIEGQTLKQLLASRGRLDERTLVPLALGVARALAAAHAKGIVHRDVKPDNIMLDAQGEARLGDLGLAKPMSGDADVTLGGRMIGTPHYVAPEQARGEQVDGRADLYSLGATLHHLLSGETLFHGVNASAITIKHVTDPPPAIRDRCPEVSAGLARIIDRLLSKDPARRHADARALIADLEAVLAGRAVGGPGARPRDRARRSDELESGRSIRPSLALLFGGGVAALALVVGLVVWAGRGAPRVPAVLDPPPSATVPVQTPRVSASQVEPVVDPAVDPAVQAAEMLAFARAFLAEHPEQVATARDYFEKARRAGKGTVVELEADQALKQLRAAEAERLEVIWTVAGERAAAAAAQGDWDGALAVLAELDGTATGTRFVAEVAAQREQLLAGARTALDGQLASVAQALASGDPDAADAALVTARELRCLVVLNDAAPRLAAQEEAIASARDATRAAVAATWLALREELLALLLEDAGQLEARLRVLRRDPQLVAVTDQFDAVAAVGAALEACRTAERDQLQARIGQPVSVHSQRRVVSGTLEGFDATWIKVARQVQIGREQQHMVVPVKWSEVLRVDWPDRQPAWRASDAAGHLAVAVIALTADDYATADAALSAAGAHPLVEPLARRIRRQRMGAVEAAAEESWQSAIAPLATRSSTWDAAAGAAAENTLRTWHEAHGGTAFAAAHGDDYAALLASARSCQQVQLLVNGDFANGQLAPWHHDPLHPSQRVEVVKQSGCSAGRALRLTSTKEGYWRLEVSQVVPVETHRPCRLLVRYRCRALDAAGRTQDRTVGRTLICMIDLGAGPDLKAIDGFAADHDWHDEQVDLVTAGQTVQVTFQLTSRRGGGPAELEIDSVSLVYTGPSVAGGIAASLAPLCTPGQLVAHPWYDRRGRSWVFAADGTAQTRGLQGRWQLIGDRLLVDLAVGGGGDDEEDEDEEGKGRLRRSSFVWSTAGWSSKGVLALSPQPPSDDE